MPPYKAYQTRPLTTEFPEGDGYRQLIAAVLERAISDALGHGDLRGTGMPAKVQSEARSWLSGRGAEELLALGGYEAEVVLRQVRRILES